MGNVQKLERIDVVAIPLVPVEKIWIPFTQLSSQSYHSGDCLADGLVCPLIVRIALGAPAPAVDCIGILRDSL